LVDEGALGLLLAAARAQTHQVSRDGHEETLFLLLAQRRVRDAAKLARARETKGIETEPEAVRRPRREDARLHAVVELLPGAEHLRWNLPTRARFHHLYEIALGVDGHHRDPRTERLLRDDLGHPRLAAASSTDHRDVGP